MTNADATRPYPRWSYSQGGMTYEERLRRQWEVNVYNNLGFLCNGYSIEETDRGHKNETRDGTDIEIDLWNRFEESTPGIPVLDIPDDVALEDCKDYIDVDIDNRCLWLRNKSFWVLFEKDILKEY